MSDLTLAEALAVLERDELAEIAERAREQAEAIRAGQDGTGQAWAIVFDYVAACASFALARRELVLSSV